ncbi:hypothetical protein QWY20_08105 [Alkalimonas sp. MEB108]|uniref:DNA-binding protein n=1 Tax=Alkalimonas cellulosilytica TaxID=3058395 RepID=A0ABU7J4U3_9GAMM|nr:hypothetical protein [Alkalimonas sp. MEB108]MEE2001414.1 hypothetical protein [Alkalimonas sp. MEB108]
MPSQHTDLMDDAEVAYALRFTKRTLQNRICTQRKYLLNGIDNDEVRRLAPPYMRLGKRKRLYLRTEFIKWLQKFPETEFN